MSFNVRTEPGGHVFEVEADDNLLSAALKQGVGLPYGCRNGQCGSCSAKLLRGEIIYPGGAPQALAGQDEPRCLTCQAVPRSDLVIEIEEVRTAAEIVIRTLPCRVVSKEQLNHDVVRIYLKLPDNQRLQFFAGQYLDFILKDGRKRAFSIANAPHDDELVELHVRHVPGGEFTDYVFDSMREKTILRIQAPLGTFILREMSDRPMMFMGGGTGFAPIKGIIEHAFHIGVDRPMHLYWGVRSQRDLYLPDLPVRWAREHSNLTYTPVLSEPDADWTGRTGFVHEAVLADHPDMSGFDIYMSGPPVMVDAGREAFQRCGATMDYMFSDAFEYAADSKKKAGAPES